MTSGPVVPIMRDRGGGTIVNVSSGSSRMVLPGVGAYAATKAALNMLSLVASEEFAPDGIVVSLVYPSVTATEFHDKLRAGVMRVGSGGLTPHSPRYVAKTTVTVVTLRTPTGCASAPRKGVWVSAIILQPYVAQAGARP